MRYVFIVLCGLIVLIALRRLARDNHHYKKQMDALPDAGFVGEMIVLDTGKSAPLPREGLIGTARRCDVRVRHKKTKRFLAGFRFIDGKGLEITPRFGVSALLNGEHFAKGDCALHGDILSLNGVEIKVRLFAGLNVPRRQRSMSAAFDGDNADFYDTDNPFFNEVYMPVENRQPYPQQPDPQGYPNGQADPYTDPYLYGYQEARRGEEPEDNDTGRNS